MAKVSIIIPCFNQGQYLDEAVDSVLMQTIDDLEIIIVNDGSTEEYTVSKLKSYNKAKCKVIHTTNQGLAAARNNGIKISSGEYILPLDADDKIGPRYLEEAVTVLERKCDIGIVYCEAEYFGARSGRWRIPVFSPERMMTMNLIFCTSLFRREDYNKTKGYNPNMKYGWEDWDFWLSILELGKNVYKLPDVHFYYRIKDRDSMIEDMKRDTCKMSYSYNTIYLNHFDFYIRTLGHPIELFRDLSLLKGSKEYLIGRILVSPIRKIRNYLKRSWFRFRTN